MDEELKIKLPRRAILFFVIMVLIYAIVATICFSYIQLSLFRERSANVQLLMEKITDNVETGLTNRWNTLHVLLHEFMDQEFSSVEALEQTMVQKIQYRQTAITALLVVDEQGICYTSDGQSFPWPQSAMPKSQDRQMYVAQDILPGQGTEMFFVQRFHTPIQVGDKTMVLLGLACDMSFVESFFSSSAFGDTGAAFILNRDGTQVYYQKSNNPLSDVKNVLSALYTADFQYGATYGELESQIRSGQSGCVSLRYNDTIYYLVYQPMPNDEWMAAMLVPESSVGSSSRVFINAIIASIGAIALGGLTVLVVILVTTNYAVRRQRQQINEQLRRAAEAERNANEAKTKFLSAMSHDIRTPMNAIIGMTSLASSRLEDTAYVRSCLGKVTQASNHLLTLINDVLDISRVESGRMSLNPVVFSLAEAVNSMASIVRPQVHDKGIDFRIRAHYINREYLFADEMRLNQIFINLLTNAVKYTPAGGKVTVDLYQRALPGSRELVRLIFVVEDNGVGMSKEFQQTMYESFTRAKNADHGAIQGTGLGLAICKQMVDLMEGTIECDSAPALGTKFTVTLDLPVAERMTDHLMLPPMKLLLVDDDEIFMESAVHTLQELGLEVDCVSDGQAAVDQVTQKHRQGHGYPAVIIDWKMPGMNGEQTVRAIRAQVGQDVPIIVISAYDRTDIEEQARAAGANGFISKPFFKSGVYRDMSRILNLEQEHQQIAHQATQEDLAGMRILVAEDNDMNWEIADSVLTMYGVQCMRAHNGRECVDILHDSDPGEFDVVLMDIQMPVMDGYEAARYLRSSPRDDIRRISILAMTADAFADDIQRCIEAGMNGHIAKPINVENLISMLKKTGGGVKK